MIHLLLSFDDRWLAKTLTQISAHWCSRQTSLISMHCSQKTFNFLNFLNGPTSVLSDIVITLHKITNTCERCFWDVSEASHKRHLFWDMLETSWGRHTRHVFLNLFETSSYSCHKKVISFEMFLRGLWDVSLNGGLIEISQRHLMPAGLIVM